MKKAKRIVALALALLLCLPLCSCKELDDMRAHHAFLQEDGTVLWNEAVYKLLPEYDDEVFEEYDFYVNAVGSVYVTEADVPVLLSDTLGKRMYAYKNGEVIMRWQEKGVFYCRVDVYDHMVNGLNAIIERKVAVGYSIAVLDRNTGNEVVLPLTDQQRETVDTVLDRVKPFVSEQNLIYFDAVTLFSHNLYGELLGEIAVLARMTDDTYQIVACEDGATEQCYPVPEEYYPIFDTLMIPFWKSQGMTEDMFPKR